MKAYTKASTKPDTSFAMTFGKFLEQEGLTEDEVAATTGRSQSSVSNWKTGHNPPADSSVAVLAAAYPKWANRFYAAKISQLRAGAPTRTDHRRSG